MRREFSSKCHKQSSGDAELNSKLFHPFLLTVACIVLKPMNLYQIYTEFTHELFVCIAHTTFDRFHSHRLRAPFGSLFSRRLSIRNLLQLLLSLFLLTIQSGNDRCRSVKNGNTRRKTDVHCQFNASRFVKFNINNWDWNYYQTWTFKGTPSLLSPTNFKTNTDLEVSLPGSQKNQDKSTHELNVKEGCKCLKSWRHQLLRGVVLKPGLPKDKTPWNQTVVVSQ